MSVKRHILFVCGGADSCWPGFVRYILIATGKSNAFIVCKHTPARGGINPPALLNPQFHSSSSNNLDIRKTQLGILESAPEGWTQQPYSIHPDRHPMFHVLLLRSRSPQSPPRSGSYTPLPNLQISWIERLLLAIVKRTLRCPSEPETYSHPSSGLIWRPQHILVIDPSEAPRLMTEEHSVSVSQWPKKPYSVRELN